MAMERWPRIFFIRRKLVVVRGFFLVSGGILLRRMDLLRSYLPKKFVFQDSDDRRITRIQAANAAWSDFSRLDVDGSRLRLDHEFGIPLVLHHVWRLDVRQRNESGTAVMILTCAYLVAKGPLKGIFNTKQLTMFHLGIAFTVFWRTLPFPYFLIWNANIPEEAFWFNDREQEFDDYIHDTDFGYFLFPSC